MKIRRIISGGQTGADRAALDFALENRIESGGFVPKNRLAEDGGIGEKYPNLVETETENPAERTELNVIGSDATLIFSHGELKGGSKLTAEFAEKHRKPFLHVDFSELTTERAVEKTKIRLDSLTRCESLNIAGARASEDAEIYRKTKEFLEGLFKQDGQDRQDKEK
ncbi:MAG TPA: putative molybdenum carrier protein [Pyrinomonadaceae bacterium]|nr:putative molybdenum carrier protein [Pyrinomonadaceae bacterium]